MNQTLGQYYLELRNAARSFPMLARAAVEAMTAEKILLEMRRRSYRLPPYYYRAGEDPSRVQHATWVKSFVTAQSADVGGMSSREVAKRAGLDPAAVWKLEHDKPVRAETVQTVLVNGLGLTPDGPELRRALALWTGSKTSVKVDADFTGRIADVQKDASFNQFLQRAVPILATIPASEYDAVLEALGNPATVESLAALNKLAVAGKAPRLKVLRRPEK